MSIEPGVSERIVTLQLNSYTVWTHPLPRRKSGSLVFRILIFSKGDPTVEGGIVGIK